MCVRAPTEGRESRGRFAWLCGVCRWMAFFFGFTKKKYSKGLYGEQMVLVLFGASNS